MAPKWFWRDLAGGETGRDVDVVKRKLLVPSTGPVFDEATMAVVRGVQKVHGMPPTGVVDRDVAELIGESVEDALPHEWYHRVLKVGSKGEDVAALHDLMHLPFGDRYGTETRLAVLRFQSEHHLPLTGKVDKKLVNLL